MVSAKVISLGAAQITAQIGALARKVQNPGEGFMIAGRAVQNDLKKHFRGKNQKPNKRGWKKSGFWSQIRDSTQLLRLGEGSVVQVNDPRFNQKLHGGTITPKRGKALAIPMEQEFYGVNPSTFQDRFFYVGRRKKTARGEMVGLLAEQLSDKSIRVAYILMKSVDQDADEDALPPMRDLERVAVEALAKWVKRQTGKK
jgi:hypothetical protein